MQLCITFQSLPVPVKNIGHCPYFSRHFRGTYDFLNEYYDLHRMGSSAPGVQQ